MNMLPAADGVQLISTHIGDVTSAAKLADSSASQAQDASKLLSEQARLLENESRTFIENTRNAS